MLGSGTLSITLEKGRPFQLPGINIISNDMEIQVPRPFQTVSCTLRSTSLRNGIPRRSICVDDRSVDVVALVVAF